MEYLFDNQWIGIQDLIELRHKNNPFLFVLKHRISFYQTNYVKNEINLYRCKICVS